MNTFLSQKGDNTDSPVVSTYHNYKHTPSHKHTENYDPSEKNIFTRAT